MSSRIKIVIAGEGGQGVQTMAKVISSFASALGYYVTYIPSFGVEQRGTPSIAFITIDKMEDISYPRFDKANYLILMQQRAFKSIKRYIANDTKIIFDSSSVDHKCFNKRVGEYFGIPAIEISRDKFIPQSFNIMLLGKIASLLLFDKKEFFKSIELVLKKKIKDEKTKKSYFNAYIFGYNFVFENEKFTKARFFPDDNEIALKGHSKVGRIIPNRCKSCGICIEKCPVKALKFGETLGVFANPVPEVDLEKCIACGNCQRFCPDSAIFIKKVSSLQK